MCGQLDRGALASRPPVRAALQSLVSIRQCIAVPDHRLDTICALAAKPIAIPRQRNAAERHRDRRAQTIEAAVHVHRLHRQEDVCPCGSLSIESMRARAREPKGAGRNLQRQIYAVTQAQADGHGSCRQARRLCSSRQCGLRPFRLNHAPNEPRRVIALGCGRPLSNLRFHRVMYLGSRH
jgi:hypothetical protein